MRPLSPADASAFGARLHTALASVMRRSAHAWRWYSKPRGYAGDYLTIARVYDDEVTGDRPMDRVLDRCFLRLPATRAVQNRRQLVVGEIRNAIAAAAAEGRPARVTSLACGPAREVFDTFLELPEPSALVSTLVDFDAEALEYCADERVRRGVAEDVHLVNANLIHVALGRRPLELEPQDLVYSIGLIDYFPDRIVVKLLDRLYDVLRPGGRVILGNFHPRNPTRAIMDHVLDWKLIHRDEEQMHALFRASAFGQRATRIVYEREGVNLFAECVKS
ncbi:MAG: class I SAM-dependent methyltransferase [Deltaproteobacteria bacterium]|nr:class I SAM-dependent methyltransferase [Deltaproteobacteria bacterium]